MTEIKSIVLFRDGKIRYSEADMDEWWAAIDAAARKNATIDWVMRHHFVHLDDPAPGQHTTVTYIFPWADVEYIRAATDSDRAWMVRE